MTKFNFIGFAAGDPHVGIPHVVMRIEVALEGEWDEDVVPGLKEGLAAALDLDGVMTEAEHKAEMEAEEAYFKQMAEEAFGRSE